MSFTIVGQGEQIELSSVEDDLEIHDKAVIEVSSEDGILRVEGKIISYGNVLILGSVISQDLAHERGKLEISGDLEVNSVIVSKGRTVEGPEARKGFILSILSSIVKKIVGKGTSLVVGGNLKGKEIYNEGSLHVSGNLECPDVEIIGSCLIGGTTEVEEFEVMGSSVHGNNFIAEEVDISGSLSVEGNLTIEDEIEVRGSVNVQGMFESDEIEVTGSLTAGQIKANDVEVGGSLNAVTIESESIKVGGSIFVDKIKSKEIKTGGSIVAIKVETDVLSARGSVNATKAIIHKSYSVGGSFFYDEILETKELPDEDFEYEEFNENDEEIIETQED